MIYKITMSSGAPIVVDEQAVPKIFREEAQFIHGRDFTGNNFIINKSHIVSVRAHNVDTVKLGLKPKQNVQSLSQGNQ